MECWRGWPEWWNQGADCRWGRRRRRTSTRQRWGRCSRRGWWKRGTGQRSRTCTWSSSAGRRPPPAGSAGSRAGHSTAGTHSPAHTPSVWRTCSCSSPSHTRSSRNPTRSRSTSCSPSSLKNCYSVKVKHWKGLRNGNFEYFDSWKCLERTLK